MILFLTSSIGPIGADRRIREIFKSNSFPQQLKSRWPSDADILIMAADPAKKDNDGWIEVITNCCHDGGLSFRSVQVCDERNPDSVNRIAEYDVVVLAGGHVPTQNDFFSRVGLKEKLKCFRGLVIGISAGSMNSADVVYVHVECDGEADDPDYARFRPGLNLTKRMILPHYQQICNDTIKSKDGKRDIRVFEDVAYPDSWGHEFLCLNDGSYILCEAGREVLFGDAWLLKNGCMTQICRDGETLVLE